MSTPPSKRRKQSPDSDNESGSSHSVAQGSSSGASSGSESYDTDDEIATVKKSLKTGKRKRRATEPNKFGDTLQSLLHTDAPSALPLSLKPSISRKHNDEKLELKAKKVLQTERKEQEDKGRIVDVIGGWGGENERALRKVAQRGVVKLFNLIQQSQASATAAIEKSKAQRGSGKPTLPAPAADTKRKSRGTDAGAAVKDDFFDMIRSGGLVSKQ
ncbi:hypothetical protein PC9H_003560 [Pleurotus ostreatus]|uniref:Rrp15p-domain-containing protein n=2 Tax=Pleurotus TaxID=5320 RepID=A0A8H7A258_PLEOS|nr:uncharacterized protein PC9H_003560 [Pleurotus ostreatus]KAF7436727.1 hypothetical protein PC9H_003560 [Pleurotus ostreatus]KAG9222720.1 hypothetical protein CCMSSC00406_0004634 [Pleurotus cornucopiae]